MTLRWGLGPVFAYEWLTTSRRWQLFALRSLLVAILGIALAVVWWMKLAGQPLTIRTLAQTGESFFYALVGTQLALVLLAAPAYTAGSICLDKARGTLQHLLVTDLADHELILGKLAARCLPVLGLVACAVPVLFGAILLGGIAPDAAIGAVLITLGTGIFGCALALALSVWGRKTHEVLSAAYLLMAVLILAGPMWRTIPVSWGMPAPPSWLEKTNPFLLAFLPYLRPTSTDLSDPAIFLAVALMLAAILTGLAVLRVRAVALRQAARPLRLRRSRLARTRRLTGWLPGPSLDGNPVLWREWYRQRPSIWLRLVWLLYGSLAVVFSFIAIMANRNPMSPVPPCVNALQVPFGLLLVSVSAVTVLADERVRGSLDVLLATPLPTWKIVWGKWWGTYRLVPRLAVLPSLIVFAGALRGGHGVGVLLLVAMILAYGAAVTSLGLALATWMARQGRALAVAVVLLVLATVVPFLPLSISGGGPRSLLGGVAAASPFFGVGELTDAMLAPPGPMYPHLFECMAWNALWILVYGTTALVLYLLTLATFDRSLGRLSAFHRGSINPFHGHRPAKSRLPAQIAIPDD